MLPSLSDHGLKSSGQRKSVFRRELGIRYPSGLVFGTHLQNDLIRHFGSWILFSRVASALSSHPVMDFYPKGPKAFGRMKWNESVVM